MKKNNPKLYFYILLISIILFILEVFIIQLDGWVGLIICILSVYFIIGSIIRLCRLSNLFKESIMEAIDILFFL